VPSEPSAAQPFDIVVLGAGTGGYAAAFRAGQLGLRVALVDDRPAGIGGTCLHVGCIPTKALLEHAHAYKIVQQAKEWGIVLGVAAPSIDIGRVHARKDKIVTTLTKGVVAASDLVRGYWFILFPAMGLSVWGFRRWKKTPSGRRAWDIFKLRVPGGIGKWVTFPWDAPRETILFVPSFSTSSMRTTACSGM